MSSDSDRRRAEDRALRDQTRRQFFERCGVGLGTMALASLLNDRGAAAARGATPDRAPRRADPLAARPGHFPARARSVIYLFMAGAPSQLELFDHKPALHSYNNQPIPESF